MLVAIHAFEDTYYGMHGYESFEIHDVNNMQEAYDIAREASLDIITGYSDIQNEIIDIINYEYDLDEEENASEYDEIYSDIVESKISFNVCPLKEERVKDYDIDTLSKMYYNNPEEFLKEFADEEKTTED